MAQGRTLWDRSTGAPLPSDLPSNRYELRFTVGQGVADTAIALWWQNKIATKEYSGPSGQSLQPIALFQDADNPQGLKDLVLLVDLEGFWPELLGVALVGIGLGIVAIVTLREIRQVAQTPGGSLLLGGAGLLLILIVGVAVFALVKTRGAPITRALPAS